MRDDAIQARRMALIESHATPTAAVPVPVQDHLDDDDDDDEEHSPLGAHEVGHGRDEYDRVAPMDQDNGGGTPAAAEAGGLVLETGHVGSPGRPHHTRHRPARHHEYGAGGVDRQPEPRRGRGR